jgi:hypothetical protein
MTIFRGKKSRPVRMVSSAALTLILGFGLSSCSPPAERDASEQKAEAPKAAEQKVDGKALNEQDPTVQNAKARLKAMSDYLAANKAISMGYDSVFEVVTKEKQKLQLATSGTIVLNRPDKIRTTRQSGFADTEMVFDGQMLTILGKGQNAYVQAKVPGTIDNLIEQLRDRFKRQIPGADLLAENVYGQLTGDVTDVKDLGSGVISGTECDHFAFRTKETDWQIWIAQGKDPYPCRYVITSKDVDQSPQFTLVVRDWKAGAAVGQSDFAFNAPAGAKLLDANDMQALKESSDLPENYKVGDSQ